MLSDIRFKLPEEQTHDDEGDRTPDADDLEGPLVREEQVNQKPHGHREESPSRVSVDGNQERQNEIEPVVTQERGREDNAKAAGLHVLPDGADTFIMVQPKVEKAITAHHLNDQKNKVHEPNDLKSFEDWKIVLDGEAERIEVTRHDDRDVCRK